MHEWNVWNASTAVHASAFCFRPQKTSTCQSTNRTRHSPRVTTFLGLSGEPRVRTCEMATSQHRGQEWNFVVASKQQASGVT